MRNGFTLAIIVVTMFLCLLCFSYADAGLKASTGDVNTALTTLTDKEVLDFFKQASNISQLIYVVLVVLVIIIVFNLVLFAYLIMSNNKSNKRYTDSTELNAKNFSMALENSSKIHAEALKESSKLYQGSLDKNSQTLGEVSKSLNLLSKNMSETNITLKNQYCLIEKLLDQVMSDMNLDHQKISDVLHNLKNECIENFTWCKTKNEA